MRWWGKGHVESRKKSETSKLGVWDEGFLSGCESLERQFTRNIVPSPSKSCYIRIYPLYTNTFVVLITVYLEKREFIGV